MALPVLPRAVLCQGGQPQWLPSGLLIGLLEAVSVNLPRWVVLVQPVRLRLMVRSRWQMQLGLRRGRCL